MYSLYRQTAYIDQVRSTRIKRKQNKREWKILGAKWREGVSQKSWESTRRSSLSKRLFREQNNILRIHATIKKKMQSSAKEKGIFIRNNFDFYYISIPNFFRYCTYD